MTHPRALLALFPLTSSVFKFDFYNNVRSYLSSWGQHRWKSTNTLRLWSLRLSWSPGSIVHAKSGTSCDWRTKNPDDILATSVYCPGCGSHPSLGARRILILLPIDCTRQHQLWVTARVCSPMRRGGNICSSTFQIDA